MKLSLSKNLIILLSLALAYFFFYSFLFWSTSRLALNSNSQVIFNWPDETANFFFAHNYSQHGTLSVAEPLNIVSANLLHGRSFNVLSNGSLVPVTYLPNIVILGQSIKILGTQLAFLLIPLLALGCVFIFYRIINLIFKDDSLAFVSALLLMSLAPWVYFANFSYLTNILFIFLAISGFWLLAEIKVTGKYNLYLFLAGILFWSFAIINRPSEIVWMIFLLIFTVYWQRKNINYGYYLPALIIMALVAYGFLVLNKNTYGNYLSLGYFDLANNNLPGATQVTATNSGFNILKILFAPFGFNFVLILKNIYLHFFKIIWPLILLAAYAKIELYRNKQLSSRPWNKYFIILPVVAYLVFIYYGSWQLSDTLVLELNTISVSYVRYFLPLYIILLPLAGYGFINFFTKVQLKYVKYFLLSVIMFFGVAQAYLPKNDGLLATQANLEKYYSQLQGVQKVAPAGSVIVTERTDKVFFPYYKVVIPQGDYPLWPRLKALLEQGQNIYYYDEQGQSNELRAAASEFGLSLGPAVYTFEKFNLYPIIKN